MATPQIDTYTKLATEIGTFVNRGDLTSEIPNFIVLAEARLRRADIQRTIESTFTIAAAENALPADFRRPVDAWYEGTTYFGNFDLVTPTRLGDIEGAVGGVVGVPRAGAVIDNGGSYVLRVAPAPDSPTAYVIRLVYDQSFTPLDSGVGSSTNWILQNYPDLYLYGALTETAPFLKDDERIPVWDTRFKEALEELRKHHEKKKFGGSPLVIRPRKALGG